MKHIFTLMGKVIPGLILVFCLFLPRLSYAQYYPPPYNVDAIFNNDLIPLVDVSWDHDTDSVQYFIVERDGYPIGTTTGHYYMDQPPFFINYCYTVIAVYITGNSDPGGPSCTIPIDLYPEMTVLPEYAEYAVPVNDSIEYTLSIINSGEYGLQYDIVGFTPYASPPGFITIDDLGIGWVDPYGGQKDIPVKWSSAGYGPGTYSQDLVVLGNDPDNMVDIVPNIMHVGPFSYVSGTITDALSLDSLHGVEITAGLEGSQTNADGYFLLRLPPNSSYDLYLEKPGYETMYIPIATGDEGTTLTLDVSLQPLSSGLNWVIAEVDCNDPAPAEISWSEPENFGELLYDNDFCTDFHAWDFPGGEHAVRFTPTGYPANVYGGSFYVGRGVYPDGNWLNTSVSVLVYDEGPDGMPGDVVDSTIAIISDYGWVDCYFGNDTQIDSGDFFISVVQANMFPNTPPIGVDENSSQYNYSYSRPPLENWDTASFRNFMIRAEISYESGNNVSGYIISRASDFNPIIGPQTGTLTILDTVTALNYIDSGFEFVEEDWYAYAVKPEFTNGQSGQYVYSNTIGHDMGKIVSFQVEDCGGTPIDSVEIIMFGLDYPYALYTSPDSSYYGLDCVWKGYYDVSVTAPGFDPVQFDVQILADTTFFFMFDSTLYLVSNLWVDTISTTAYWDPPSDTSAFMDYSVYLDGQYSGNTDSTYYQFTGLPFNQYTVCVEANYACGPSDPVCVDFGGGYLPAPDWITGDSIGSDILLTWYMDTTGFGDALTGFKLYRDSTYFKYIPYVMGQDTFTYLDTNLLPMCYEYHVSTFYDLESYGYSMQFGDSDWTGPEEVCLSTGDAMPIFEDWSSGSFGTFWTADQNWRINGQYGNPMPAAEFTWDPVLTNYQSSLTSGYINGVYMDSTKQEYLDGKFMLKFDLKLDDNSSTGTEHFKAEVWSDGNWHTVFASDNSGGSFDWTTETIDITSFALGYVYKLRFMAEGESSMNILSWFVDNIEVFHYCAEPLDLNIDLFDELIPFIMTWSPPENSNGSPIGYNIYYAPIWPDFEYLDFTTDTFYVHDQYYYNPCYYVTGVYESCESDQSNIVCWLVSIDEPGLIGRLKVFPVPTRDELKVESDLGIFTLCLLDLSGRELYCKENIHEKQYRLNVSAYDPGVYLLRIDTEQGRVVKKIVIAR